MDGVWARAGFANAVRVAGMYPPDRARVALRKDLMISMILPGAKRLFVIPHFPFDCLALCV